MGIIQMIPVVGLIISLPLQLINSFVTIFLSVAMGGAYLAYYLKKTEGSPTPEPPVRAAPPPPLPLPPAGKEDSM
jgi:hypothetical protein